MKSVNWQDVVEANLRRVEKKSALLLVQANSQTNIMTIGWALCGVIWRKPTMLVAVRDSRFTFGIIEKANSFSVTFPAEDMKKEIEICGTKSGRDLDKFRACGFTTAKASKIETPLLQVPGTHYECRIVYKSAMDPKLLAPDLETLYPAKDYHTLYYGEILACWQSA